MKRKEIKMGLIKCKYVEIRIKFNYVSVYMKYKGFKYFN